MKKTETLKKSPEDASPFVLRADDAPVPGVTRLTLNRPDELNALSEGMLAALQSEFDAIANDRAVRVVLLTGSPLARTRMFACIDTAARSQGEQLPPPSWVSRTRMPTLARQNANHTSNGSK